MVKGNKFKTAEFLQQQALKTKSQPPAATQTPVQPAKAPSKGNSAAKTVQPAALSAQHNNSVKQTVQQQIAKLGSKRKAASEALTEVSNVSPASDTQTPAPIGKKQKKRKKQQHKHNTDAAQETAAPAPKMHKLTKQASKLPTILAAPAPQGKAVNSNWAALKGLVASSAHKRQPASGNPASDRPAALKAPEPVGTRAGVTPVVAIDCEMVGVGPDGTRSALAR